MSLAASIQTSCTMCPRMSIPRMFCACSSASTRLLATLIPPAFPRPPICTCALTTQGYPISSAAATASSTVVAGEPLGTGTPWRAKSCLPWYSSRSIGGRPSLSLRPAPDVRVAPVDQRRAFHGRRELLLHGVEHRLDQVHRQREDDRRVLVDADLAQGLEIAQLYCRRVLGDDVGGLAQARGGLELALGVDDLRAPLALGLGLTGHRVLHPLRDPDVLDLDGRDLHSPRLRLLVDDLLELVVELLALGEQRVEVGLAEHRAQRGLRDLRGGLEEALDLDDRVVGGDDAEIDDGVDAGGDVVARDHVLRWDVEGDRAQADALHAVDGGDQEHEARPLGADHPAEPEDDGSLVLAHDADRGGGERQRAGQDDDQHDRYGFNHSNSHSSAGRTVRVSPLMFSTTTGRPSESGLSSSSPHERARQSAPSTNTQSAVLATPTRPMRLFEARRRRTPSAFRTIA